MSKLPKDFLWGGAVAAHQLDPARTIVRVNPPATSDFTADVTALAAGDPQPYQRRAMTVSVIADEAVLDLAAFSLDGSARASLRHSVSAARRLGLRIESHTPAHDAAVAAVSARWLGSKRGGEYGFTLSRHDEVAEQVAAGITDSWVCVDDQDRLHAWCTWRHYADGSARVLDVMRRDLVAANPAMDFLLASTLLHYRTLGVAQASLASVPRDRGDVADDLAVPAVLGRLDRVGLLGRHGLGQALPGHRGLLVDSRHKRIDARTRSVTDEDSRGDRAFSAQVAHDPPR